jgi:hypothetical protein
MAPSPPRPPIPPLFTKVTVKGTSVDTEWANIFYLSTPDAADASVAQAIALAGQIFDIWADHIMPILSDDCHLTEVALVVVPAADMEIVASFTGDVAGGVSSAPLPASCAAVISWKISAYYRGGHPRSYIAGLPESAMVPATSTRELTTAFTTALLAAAGVVLTQINDLVLNTANAEMGTLSYVAKGVYRAIPIFRQYLDMLVDQRLDSQRRRLGKP